MEKIQFFSAIRNFDKEKNFRMLRNGYLIKGKENTFGVFKNESGLFDIIDLKTGLSVNFLHYYKLKDFKNDIQKFDDKLNDYKEKNKNFYNELIKNFNSYEIFEECHLWDMKS